MFIKALVFPVLNVPLSWRCYVNYYCLPVNFGHYYEVCLASRYLIVSTELQVLKDLRYPILAVEVTFHT